MKKTLLAVALCMMLAPMTSCAGGGDTPKEQEFTNVYFDNVDVVYDGEEHILGEVRGAPEGTNIVYEGRVPHIDIGTYEASATLSKEGYKTKTLEATLTITAQEFKNVYFDDVTIYYDGQSHILGEVRGAPEGTDITYNGRESHTDVGKYNATATLSKEGYATKTLTATLTIKGQEFTGVEFKSKQVEYDGNPHILSEVSGAPEGTNITYTGRESHTNAGTYNASATLSKTGYVTKTLTAALTITKIDFSGFVYESKLVTYDGKNHFEDIQLIGNRPEGTKVNITVKNIKGETISDKAAINTGVYDYTAVITNPNYNDVTLKATLTIMKQRVDMPVFASGDGTIYFANGRDNQFLYSLKDSTFKRIDSSSPKEFNKYSPTKALFIAGTPLMNAVKEVEGDKTSVIYTDGNIDDFVKYNDSIYYYSSNSLSSEKSGIYKVDATNSDDEPVVTKIFDGKTDNLLVDGNNLYFTNTSDNNFLYKIDLSSTKFTSSLILDKKIREFTVYNGKAYCAINDVLNDHIGSINLSSGKFEKITNASGEFLTVKNNKLYFNYTDMYGVLDPTQLGIWSINLSTKKSERVVKISGVNGFDVESDGSVIYIDTTDLHLYRYKNEVATDLLADFEMPEITRITTGGHTVAYESKIYYLNMYAGKTLYVYDESTGDNYQLTTDKVEDFFIYDDKLYFNQVTMLTNNDLYVVDLKVNSEAQKINTNDVRGMVCDGTYIYGVHHNFLGGPGGLSRMKLDGSEYVKFSEVNAASNLTIRDEDNRLYFINNNNIEYIELSAITPTSENLPSTNLSEDIEKVKQFIFDGDNIFYMYDGPMENSIRRTNFQNFEEQTKIASTKTNPNEMILSGGFVYYYSFAATALKDAGFYKVDKNAVGDGTQEIISSYNVGDKYYYGSALAISGSNLYFLNHMALLGDEHTYQLNLDTKTISEIA